MYRQIQMFPDTKQQELEKRVESLQEKYDSLRKGQYAKITEAKKIALEAREEIAFLKSMICKNNPSIWSL